MGANEFLTGIPIIGGLFDDSEEKMLAEMGKNRDLFNGIDLPDYSTYRPEEYSYVGDYVPELARGETVSEDPMLKSAQLSALNKLSGLADTGLSEMDVLGFQNARDMAARESRGQRDAVLQNAQARGVAGGGMEFALKEQGNQAAANRAAQSAREQAAESAKMRALYTQAYGDALGGVRDQDYRTARGNADILNQFNMENTKARNTAAQWNTGRRQELSNANVGERNSAQKYGNDMRRQTYEDEIRRAQGIAGVNSQAADYYGAQGAERRKRRAAAGQAVGAGIGAAVGGPAGAKVGATIGGGVGGFY